MANIKDCYRTMNTQGNLLLLDTGIGNIQSVANVLDHFNFTFKISKDPKDLAAADKVILPGVGSFGNAIKRIHDNNLFEPLQKIGAENSKPMLAICVGMQVLSRCGFEFGSFDGLNIVDGEVRQIASDDKELRLPHVGWNEVKFSADSPLFKGIAENSTFYFTHSFHFQPEDSAHSIAHTHYGIEFTSAVQKDNIFGVQFHPEKSQTVGLQLIKNFLEF